MCGWNLGEVRQVSPHCCLWWWHWCCWWCVYWRLDVSVWRVLHLLVIGRHCVILECVSLWVSDIPNYPTQTSANCWVMCFSSDHDRQFPLLSEVLTFPPGKPFSWWVLPPDPRWVPCSNCQWWWEFCPWSRWTLLLFIYSLPSLWLLLPWVVGSCCCLGGGGPLVGVRQGRHLAAHGWWCGLGRLGESLNPFILHQIH